MRHGAAGEAPHDRLRRLDVVDRSRSSLRKLEQIAELERRAAVDEVGEPLVVATPECMRGLLQRVDDGRARRVRLAALAELHVARVLERACALPLEDLPLELGESDAPDDARSPGQAEVDDVRRKADGLEELRAAVRRHVGDAHLRHDLQDAVLDGVAEAELRLGGRRVVAAELVVRCQGGDRLEREAWTDRVRAVCEQAGEVVRLARLLCVDDDRHVRSASFGDQALVDRSDGEHGRNAPRFEHDERCVAGGRLVREPPAGTAQALTFVECGRQHHTAAGELRDGARKRKEALELE